MKEAFGPPTSAVTTTPEPENGTFSCMRNDIRNDVVAERDSMSSYQRCMRPGNSMKCEADTHFLSHANSAVSHQTVDSPRGTHFVDETTSFSSQWCFDNGGPSLPRGLEYGDEIPSLSSQKCNGNVALSYSSQWEYGAEIPSLSSRQGYGAEIPSLSSTQSYGAEIPSLSSRQGYSAEIPLLSSRQGYGDEIPSLSRHWRYRDKLTLHSSRWCHDAEAHPLPSYQQGTYRNGHSRDKFVSSLVSNQQVKMITSKHTVARPRVPNRVVNSPDHYRINKKDNPWRNSEDIQDQVCGPRANKLNNSSTPSTEKDIMSPMVRRDQINRSDFSVQYEHAKFFIIKSYSEDDIHKGIKYNVWASTPNGNNKLDAAFHEAQILMKEKGTKCPVFLFFSVNTSGQFVGLAEMLGPVDFKKTMDFWQQDKWNGFFPVMWHIMKDIPNRLFKHITLENNNNRPVTFSRDTQEIGLPQGLEMLKIFKAYRHGTSILDDFNFYEVKENARCARKGTNADSIHEARHTFLGKQASLSDDFRSMENLEASMESMSFYETWD